MSRHRGSRREGGIRFRSYALPAETADNQSGVDESVFTEMAAGIKKDRADFMQSFGKSFFGVGVLSSPVSDAVLHQT